MHMYTLGTELKLMSRHGVRFVQLKLDRVPAWIADTLRGAVAKRM